MFEHGGSVRDGQLLHYAVRRNLPDYLEVLALVLSKNPPVNHVMYQEDCTSYMRQRAFGLGTPLHEAAARGRLDVVQTLLANGSNPLIRDSCGDLPLQRAEKANHISVCAYLQQVMLETPWPERQFTEGKQTTGWS